MESLKIAKGREEAHGVPLGAENPETFRQTIGDEVLGL